MDMTKKYNTQDFKDEFILTTLKEVYTTLKERGYNPVNQIVGYLMSGDPGYITNHNDARNKILAIDRSRIIETVLKETIK